MGGGAADVSVVMKERGFDERSESVRRPAGSGGESPVGRRSGSPRAGPRVGNGSGDQVADVARAEVIRRPAQRRKHGRLGERVASTGAGTSAPVRREVIGR